MPRKENNVLKGQGHPTDNSNRCGGHEPVDLRRFYKRSRQKQNEKIIIQLEALTATLADMVTTMDRLIQAVGRYEHRIKHCVSRENAEKKHNKEKGLNDLDVKKGRRQFTLEEQDIYAAMVVSGQKTVSSLAREIQVCERSIRRWRQSYLTRYKIDAQSSYGSNSHDHFQF